MAEKKNYLTREGLRKYEDELQHYFPEIAMIAGKCRFDDCRHIAEPDCAVLSALEEGRISESRYRSYL